MSDVEAGYSGNVTLSIRCSWSSATTSVNLPLEHSLRYMRASTAGFTVILLISSVFNLIRCKVAYNLVCHLISRQQTTRWNAERVTLMWIESSDKFIWSAARYLGVKSFASWSCHITTWGLSNRLVLDDGGNKRCIMDNVIISVRSCHAI